MQCDDLPLIPFSRDSLSYELQAPMRTLGSLCIHQQSSDPQDHAAAMTAVVPAQSATTHRDGYGAPYLAPVFVAVVAFALWLNEYPLRSLGILYALVLVMLTILLFVHELLRPFCSSFSGVCVLFATELWVLTCAIAKYVLRGCRPQFPEWILIYEVFLALAKTGGELGGVNMVKPLNVVAYRRMSSRIGNVKRWFICLFNDTRIEFFQYNRLEHLWIKPGSNRSDMKSERVVVLYFHGGTYAFLNPRFYAPFGIRLRDHIARAIAKVRGVAGQIVQVDLLLANYRKIPEHRHPVPVDDALAMYDYLVNEEKAPPSQIIVTGDSAGGELAMPVLLRLRNAKRAMPAAAISMYPWINLLDDHKTSEHCILSASLVNAVKDHCLALATDESSSGSAPSLEERTTPASLQEAVIVNADLTGLPPLLIITGDADIHASFVDALQKPR